MNLLMISGDRSVLQGKRSAFWYTLEEFSKHWDRIDIICPRAVLSDEKGPDAQTFFGNVHFHPSPRGLWFQPWWILKKGQQLHAIYHPVVMTVHDYPPFYNGIGAMMLGRAINIPAVLEIHHLVGYPVAADFAERIGRVLSRFMVPFEAKRFTAIRTVSKSVAERLHTWRIKKSSVTVVPSFYLDHAAFSSLHAPSAPAYDIAFCARLVPNKGLDKVLRAVAKIPHATVIVIGDGPERKKCEQLAAQLDIAERIEFRGWLETQKDVLHAILSAKIFVMDSLSEGGPRIALEAMALGMPVIVTKVGVMPEVIENGVNGFFTTGEPEELAAVMRHVLADEKLRQTVGHSARKILDRFERKKLIEQYARFVKSFASNFHS